jgi:hypothetical protein
MLCLEYAKNVLYEREHKINTNGFASFQSAKKKLVLSIVHYHQIYIEIYTLELQVGLN